MTPASQLRAEIVRLADALTRVRAPDTFALMLLTGRIKALRRELFAAPISPSPAVRGREE